MIEVAYDLRLKALGPVYFEQVDDALDAVDPPDRFLCHLLLKERTYVALENNAAVSGFELHLAAGHVRVRC